jgi:DNA polymerase III subunit chi
VRSELKDAALEPVLIGVNQPPGPGRWDVLVNLGADVPEFFSRYERVAEVVDANAVRREQSRERYRYYRDRGYKLNTHQV